MAPLAAALASLLAPALLVLAPALPAPPRLALPAPPLPAAEVALEAATACFEAVDYDCAEEKLVQVWSGGPLPASSQIRARVIEAQIALGRRDEARVRTALRAVLALDPTWQPEARLPPRLRELVEEERPPPPRFFSLLTRADVTSWRLFGHDAERWSDGLGGEVGLGGVFLERWGVELALSYGDHRPRTFELSGLTLLGASVGAAVHIPAGFLDVAPGLSLGAVHVAAEGVTGADAYWGFRAELPVDVSAEVWNGLGLGARVGLSLVAVQDGDRAAFSWLLPLQAGLRYRFGF